MKLALFSSQLDVKQGKVAYSIVALPTFVLFTLVFVQMYIYKNVITLLRFIRLSYPKFVILSCIKVLPFYSP